MLTPPASVARFLIAAALLCLASPIVLAEEPPVTIDAYPKGCYDSRGWHASPQVNTGYYTVPEREYRSYFVFDLANLAGTVTTAELIVASTYSYESRDDSEHIQIHSVEGPGLLGLPTSIEAFIDLGEGTLYGEGDVQRPAAPVPGVTVFSLNGALAAINANLNGSFAIGAKLTSRNWPGTREFVWGDSPTPELTITLVLNRAPVANAGPDQTVACGVNGLAEVALNGSASSDPDGDPLTYIWSCCPDENSAVVTVSLHCGVHYITLTVSDGLETNTDLVVVTVVDLMPPWISPPDPVTVPQTQPEGALVYLAPALVLDNCDPAPTLTDDAPPDHIFPVGTTIVTYTAEDYSGNRATATTSVTVTPWIPPLSAQGPRVLNVPDQGTFTASGGQQPYLWTVSDPAIAKIVGETTGASVTVEGVGPGYCTVSVHDSCSQEVHLSLLVVLFAGPEDARTCVNHDITLTATAEPLGSNTCNPVLWSCDGDPATGDGLSFTTRFATPGAHVVTVTYEVEGLQFSAQCTVTAVTVAGISPPGPLTVCRGKTLTFTAISDPEGGFGECQPVWSGTSGASGSGVSIDVIFNTVSSDEADYQTVEVSCPSDPENVHTALVLVVQLDHMDYTTSDGRQGTVGEPAVLTVCKGATVTFTAYNQVGLTTFPDDCPEWSGTGNAAAITGATGFLQIVNFDTTSPAADAPDTVTAECGDSITASVLVVEVDRIEPPTLTACLDDLVTFTAIAKPAGASFPPDCPTWGGTALVSGTGATVTFPAVELGEFSVTATCGRTASAALTVVSGPLDPHPPGDFSVDANGDDVQVTGQPWVATKYYYSDRWPLHPFRVYINRYIPGLDRRNPQQVARMVAAGIVSATARLRLWYYDTEPPSVRVNGDPLPEGTLVAAACGKSVFEYVVDIRQLYFPEARGRNGEPPTPGVNSVYVSRAGAAVSVYAWELSFDAMSPYILIHGKGATGSGTREGRDISFWHGNNTAGTNCWKGLADEFENRNIPFDDSISLYYNPPYNISQRAIVDQARQLGAEPARIAAEFGTRHVNLICHSKGGLDTREWLVHIKPQDAPDLIVGQFITLSTPHIGSVIGDYAVDGSSLTVEEVQANTGVTILNAWLLLAPRVLVGLLDRLLRDPLGSRVKYPALIVGPKIAKLKRDGGYGGVDPQSAATIDLRVPNATAFSQANFPLLAAYSNPDGTTPTFLAIRADADLNSNFSISWGEKHYAVKYDLETGYFADDAYAALRDIASVQLKGPSGSRLVIENQTVRPELNDFLVTWSSAFPSVLPRNNFGLGGAFKRDHGTIANDRIGKTMITAPYLMPGTR